MGAPADAALSLGRAIEIFETRVRHGADDAFTRYYGACAYALHGDREAALGCLERAIHMRPDYTLARARREPHLVSVRNESAFRQMVG